MTTRVSSFGKSTDLSWDIIERPIYDFNEAGAPQIIEGQKSIRRSDNNIVLSVKPDTYHPMTNERFLEIAEKLKDMSGFEMAGYMEYKEGRTVLGYLKNTGDVIKIGEHAIEDYLLIGNSFDGSNSFFTGTVTELLRCANQFGKITKMNKVRHTKNSELRVAELLNHIESYFKERETMYTAFNRFGERIVSAELMEQAMNFLFDIKKDEEISTRKANQIIGVREAITSESKDLGDNLWGLFNGVTKYTTHDMTSKDKVFGNVFGTTDKLNQKAYQFCMANM